MEIHILNGDALKEQFPPSISGEIIVMRECLVDGQPRGDSLEQLLDNRMEFFAKIYGVTAEDYRRKTIPEIERIRRIPATARVNLWFEDDLFCQVNLWFTSFLLSEFTQVADVRLVRPEGPIQYGFGGMDQPALIKAYESAQTIDGDELEQMTRLWQCYQRGEHATMTGIAARYQARLPFLVEAVKAERERYPEDDRPGRPQRTIRALMEELGSEQFGPVFRAFHERESIYGYGDLQVRRLFDAVKAGRS
ncbi:DUF1835 domain-containing protein [Flavilitoribacter nigricans]|uniref:DUF1835 domain-containing protein n=1 Tax=Flavilitoribacter nigricans (strain ATCC 23147 / DSM 23189 / NBRC 102662 / NCIMB 1420 / SS-2) TaxID=1122177 RepID=A0A2D0MZQ8_FLAN2|nr:DUF1835 domain-containing protein [Flavilitoribacter nigricans]PHN01660.1 DUF1835 domain-containing protein [Flavilitoribacter nigricans DSM 23189 = NBRC 102662]